MSVGVGFVTYNSAATIRASVTAAIESSAERVVVVDNASTDATKDVVAELSRRYEKLHLVELRVNRGYAAGANEVMRALQDCEAVILLNPDAELLKLHIDQLRAILESDHGIGSLIPLTLSADPGYLDSLGLVITPWGSVADLAQGQPTGRWRTRVSRKAIGPCGGSAIYRTAALGTLDGPFDEGFFLYYEDADLALRLRETGWTTQVTDAVVVRHTRGGRGSLSTATPPDGAADERALIARQESYERFLRVTPLPWRTRLVGRLAASIRRRVVAERLGRRAWA